MNSWQPAVIVLLVSITLATKGVKPVTVSKLNEKVASFDCHEEGEYFLPHPHSCEKFVECVDGVGTVTACSNGLHWNSVTDSCGLPDPTICDESNLPPAPGPETEDNNDNGSVPEEGTDEGGSEIGESTEEGTNSSTDEPTQIPDEDQTDDPNDESTEATEEDVEKETESSEIEEEGEESQHPNGECDPMNGEYVQFLTDKYHCDRFYKCDWGRPILFFCPDDLHFNPTLNVCDWPMNAGCTAQTTTEALPSPTEEQTEPVTEDVEEENTEEVVTEDVEEEDTEEPTTDEPVEESTVPDTEATEAETEEATEQTEEDLDEITEPTEEDVEEETEPSEVEDPEEEEEESQNPNGECDPINGQYVQFLTDKYYCDRFYKCDWGRPVLYFCPDGLHFNPSLNVCDWPMNAGCTAQTTTEALPSPTEEQTESVTEDVEEENTEEVVTEDVEEEDTEEPTTDEPVEESTVPDTEATEAETEEATEPTEEDLEEITEPTEEDVEEETEPSEVEDPEEEEEESQNPNGECDPINGQYVQFLTDKYHCDRFYKCDWGRPVLYFCPDGLHFNPSLNVCDWPMNAGCTAQTTTEALPSPTEEQTESVTEDVEEENTEEVVTEDVEGEDTEEPTTDEPLEESTVPDTEATEAETEEATEPTEQESTEPTEEDVEEETEPSEVEDPEEEEEELQTPNGECNPINGQYVQFLTDKYHCDRFYKCDWGRPILFFCPDGLHFNPSLNVCDWPMNAGCTTQTTTDALPSPTEEQTEPVTEDVEEENTEEVVTEDVEGGTEELVTDGPVEESTVPDTEATEAETEEITVPTEEDLEDETEPSETEDPEEGEVETELPTESVPEGGPDGTCDSTNGAVSQYLPDKLHCDRFYQCVWGDPVLVYCPPGLHFNPTINVCDWPMNAGCQAG